jgi:hypothetical protein
MKTLNIYINEKLLINKQTKIDYWDLLEDISSVSYEQKIEYAHKILSERYERLFPELTVKTVDDSDKLYLGHISNEATNKASNLMWKNSVFYFDINDRANDKPWIRTNGYAFKRIGPGKRSSNEISYLSKHDTSFKSTIESFERMLKDAGFNVNIINK